MIEWSAPVNETIAPTILLEGARLRPLRMDDAAALTEYLSDPAVTELTSFPVVTRPFVESMIERATKRWAEGDLAKWAVALEEGDRVVGTCGFSDSSRQHAWAELAYDLSREYWRTGIMQRAVRAALAWTFEQTDTNRVHAFVRVDNERSQRLLERTGFSREGRLKSYRVCRGRPHDFYVYALLRSEHASGGLPQEGA